MPLRQRPLGDGRADVAADEEAAEAAGLKTRGLTEDTRLAAEWWATGGPTCNVSEARRDRIVAPLGDSCSEMGDMLAAPPDAAVDEADRQLGGCCCCSCRVIMGPKMSSLERLESVPPPSSIELCVSKDVLPKL